MATLTHRTLWSTVWPCVAIMCVDAYSKWLELVPFTNMPSALALIDALPTIFARFGLSEQLVSDNGFHFTAAKFQDFCTFCGIH